MDLQKKLIFWSMGFGVVTAALFGLKDILLPFIAGMVLAYFLDPIADKLEERGLGRLLATCLILALFMLVFILFLVILIPVIGDQLASFAKSFPGYLTLLSKNIHESGPAWLTELLNQAENKLSNGLGDVVSDGAGWVASVVKSVWTGGVAVISLISLVVVTPIVAFYMLLDWDRMVAKVDSYVPVKNKPTVRLLATQINEVMSGFIRGQGTVCIMLGTFYAISLSLIGLNYGLLIGLISGLLSFIPYVGSGTGLILSMSVALAQFWPEWTPIAGTAAIFFAGQFLEGNFLSPKLVGDKVGLHPVWLIFALFAFGYAFGFAGLLMAVPLAASIGVLLRYGLEKYHESSIYLGQPVPAKKMANKVAAKKVRQNSTVKKSRKTVRKKPGVKKSK